MGKWITRIVTVLVLGVFLYSVGRLVMIRLKYYKGEKTYGDLAEQVTATAKPAESRESTALPVSTETEDRPTPEPDDGLIEIPADEVTPITVDFDVLREINKDIVGWIYCEDSVINYPVVHAPDNEFYLERDIRLEHDACGTIFTDPKNHMGFTDSNTIVYGHHMQNMSMFASLEYWLEQEYYEEHPVMWLLTPEGDYRLDLFSGYETSAFSDTYRIFYGPKEEFTAYLQKAAAQSAFTPDKPFVPDEQARYVVLSTCAYSFNYARTVIHAKLTPVTSTGGRTNEGYK